MLEEIYFYPRSPRGERPAGRDRRDHRRAISIHAPREGSDTIPLQYMSALQVFLSTLPARGATPLTSTGPWRWKFLSTLPARGATNKVLADFYTFLFLSTLPARGATQNCPHRSNKSLISIHAPREGSDSSPKLV